MRRGEWNTQHDVSAGHNAERPKEIPKKGWIKVGKRVINQISANHIPIVSAGVAFFMFLSLFPALAALLSVYGLVADPQQVQQQMSQLTAILPEQAHQFISSTLQSVAGKSGSSLGWGFALSLLLSLWSANKSTKAIFEGVNIAYDEQDNRNFFKKNGITLLFTFAGIFIAILAMAVIIAFSAFVDKLSLGLPEVVQNVIAWGRWLVLGLFIAFSFALIYKIAPERKNPKFRWVSWGAVIATALWLIVSLAFSFYVSNFGSFDKTYGSVAAIIILMLWFFLTSFIILIGAEINAESEHQTYMDTTVGESVPMGERNAFQADHIAQEKKSD